MNGTSAGRFNFTALHHAAYTGRPDIIAALIRHRIVDVKDQHGHTALDVARLVKAKKISILADGCEADKLSERVNRSIKLLEALHRKTVHTANHKPEK